MTPTSTNHTRRWRMLANSRTRGSIRSESSPPPNGLVRETHALPGTSGLSGCGSSPPSCIPHGFAQILRERGEHEIEADADSLLIALARWDRVR